MALTSKSPKAVVLSALAAARRSIPAYSHKFSPKTFTQHQLFACLALKSFLKTDYRGLTAHLADHPPLVEMLELRRVPHFTTVEKAAKRLLKAAPARHLLDSTVSMHLGRRRRVKRSAIDSTGLECMRLAGTSFAVAPASPSPGKPWFIIIFPSWLWFATPTAISSSPLARRGPRPDVDEFCPLFAEAMARVRLLQITADAGYDSEPNHRFARDQHGVRTIIPAKHGRPTNKPLAGRYRRLMQKRFDNRAYRQRTQVETVISMIKRRQGAHVRGRSYNSQCRDLRLLVLIHNVMILVILEVFYRADLSPFL